MPQWCGEILFIKSKKSHWHLTDNMSTPENCSSDRVAHSLVDEVTISSALDAATPLTMLLAKQTGTAPAI